MVTIMVNGKQYQAQPEETAIAVLLREKIDIPYLCYHEALALYGSCRLCIVEVTAGGRTGITASCSLPVAEGLTIETESPRVVQLRTLLLEMYLAEAPGSPEIRAMAEKYGVRSTRFANMDLSATGDRCVLCGLCTRVCMENLSVGAINYIGRGITSRINAPWQELSDVCIGCGSCATVCPTKAIGIEDRDGERFMTIAGAPFSRHTLVPCDECHLLFATEKYLDHLRQQAAAQGETPPERNLCPVCARTTVAAAFGPKAWRCG